MILLLHVKAGYYALIFGGYTYLYGAFVVSGLKYDQI